ncbi:MAG: ATP synthase F0 subunit C [Candidatus Dependentiae bacterium]|nr:ATP synthase F0 subunit C [Candidatus Dependentiae bacterium]
MHDLYYILISMIPVVLASIGTSIGQGLIGKQALIAMHTQPASSQNIFKMCVIGIAITETAALMGTIMSILLITDTAPIANPYFASFGVTGIAFAVGISGFCAGIASSFPAIASCTSLARQPFLQSKLLNIMLITQTLIMAPNIFGLIVGLMIKSQVPYVHTFNQAMQLLASGISIGLGCIGPSIGLATFVFAACTALGTNKKSYNKILTFTFICEAIIETPVIFSLLISLMIFAQKISPFSNLQGWQFISAALCIGLSTISPGMNTGRIGATACKQIALNVEQYPSISKITMLALALIDSFAIYGLIISLMLLLY